METSPNHLDVELSDVRYTPDKLLLLLDGVVVARLKQRFFNQPDRDADGRRAVRDQVLSRARQKRKRRRDTALKDGKVAALRDDEGLTLMEFLSTLLEELPAPPHEELELCEGLCELFTETDENQDHRLQWQKFTNLLAQSPPKTHGLYHIEERTTPVQPTSAAAPPATDDKGASPPPQRADLLHQPCQRYKWSKCVDSSLHGGEEGGVEKARWLSGVGCIGVCETGLSALKIYSPQLKLVRELKLPGTGWCLGCACSRYTPGSTMADEMPLVGAAAVAPSPPPSIETRSSPTCKPPRGTLVFWDPLATYKVSLAVPCPVVQTDIWWVGLGGGRGRWITAGVDNRLRLWDMNPRFSAAMSQQTGHLALRMGHSDRVTGLVELSNRQQVVTSALDAQVIFWDANSMQISNRWAVLAAMVRLSAAVLRCPTQRQLSPVTKQTSSSSGTSENARQCYQIISPVHAAAYSVADRHIRGIHTLICLSPPPTLTINADGEIAPAVSRDKTVPAAATGEEDDEADDDKSDHEGDVDIHREIFQDNEDETIKLPSGPAQVLTAGRRLGLLSHAIREKSTREIEVDQPLSILINYMTAKLWVLKRKSIAIFSLDDGEEKRQLYPLGDADETGDKELTCCSLDGCWQRFIVGDDRGGISMHFCGSGERIVSLRGHEGCVVAVIFCVKQKLVLSAALDGMVRIFSDKWRDRKVPLEKILPIACGDMSLVLSSSFDVAFAPDDSNELSVWDIAHPYERTSVQAPPLTSYYLEEDPTAEPEEEDDRLEGNVSTACSLEPLDVLATTSHSGQVVLWSLKEAKAPSRLPKLTPVIALQIIDEARAADVFSPTVVKHTIETPPPPGGTQRPRPRSLSPLMEKCEALLPSEWFREDTADTDPPIRQRLEEGKSLTEKTHEQRFQRLKALLDTQLSVSQHEMAMKARATRKAAGLAWSGSASPLSSADGAKAHESAGVRDTHTAQSAQKRPLTTAQSTRFFSEAGESTVPEDSPPASTTSTTTVPLKLPGRASRLSVTGRKSKGRTQSIIVDVAEKVLVIIGDAEGFIRVVNVAQWLQSFGLSPSRRTRPQYPLSFAKTPAEAAGGNNREGHHPPQRPAMKPALTRRQSSGLSGDFGLSGARRRSSRKRTLTFAWDKMTETTATVTALPSHKWHAHTERVSGIEVLMGRKYGGGEGLVTSSLDFHVKIWSISGQLLGTIDTRLSTNPTKWTLNEHLAFRRPAAFRYQANRALQTIYGGPDKWQDRLDGHYRHRITEAERALRERERLEADIKYTFEAPSDQAAQKRKGTPERRIIEWVLPGPSSSPPSPRPSPATESSHVITGDEAPILHKASPQFAHRSSAVLQLDQKLQRVTDTFPQKRRVLMEAGTGPQGLKDMMSLTSSLTGGGGGASPVHTMADVARFATTLKPAVQQQQNLTASLRSAGGVANQRRQSITRGSEGSMFSRASSFVMSQIAQPGLSSLSTRLPSRALQSQQGHTTSMQQIPIQEMRVKPKQQEDQASVAQDSAALGASSSVPALHSEQRRPAWDKRDAIAPWRSVICRKGETRRVMRASVWKQMDEYPIPLTDYDRRPPPSSRRRGRGVGAKAGRLT
ncbi:unnamed protein product [Vitrella brassicaformis CCMP3155]|uniref:Uncharacterized protein n=2 Tax=Vitrella brassicaformis TaxID=1169539 RepID=A0A0G4GDJ3_VITBC|nr:unnamed protein product [Vitrella brassicaformis CCMP3155]|eukprot:CEM27478.1 unnamed protein product [Vitrella brassicaformis CCMP3155]